MERASWRAEEPFSSIASAMRTDAPKTKARARIAPTRVLAHRSARFAGEPDQDRRTAPRESA
jgi:hypothetical protein